MSRPTKEEAEKAVRTLIQWAGDDPYRSGLADTPRRVIESYKEFFKGHNDDVESILGKTFDDVKSFNDFIILKGIRFTSFCEHHILPIMGYVDVAYLPNKKVVGISKIARVVNAFSHRLQIQERFTSQIGDAIQKHLKPRGVAVYASANHQCMTIRGVNKDSVLMDTYHYTGKFTQDEKLRERFISSIIKK
ncbi:MAG: GTP cyclohydrolase I FolE [Rickettsiales bacterium]